MHLWFHLSALNEILHKIRVLCHLWIGLKHAQQEFVSLPRNSYVLGDLRVRDGLVLVSVHGRIIRSIINLLHAWRDLRRHAHKKGWWVLRRLMVHQIPVLWQVVLVLTGRL